MLCYVLCRTLQSPKLSAAEGNAIAHDVIKVLYKDKNEHPFKLFWDKLLLKKEKPGADDPKLSRKRRMPARLDHGDPSNNYFPSSPRESYRHIYFNAFDATIESIRARFNHADFKCYSNLQDFLLKVVTGEPFEEELSHVSSFYGNDVNHFQLKAQFPSANSQGYGL